MRGCCVAEMSRFCHVFTHIMLTSVSLQDAPLTLSPHVTAAVLAVANECEQPAADFVYHEVMTVMVQLSYDAADLAHKITAASAQVVLPQPQPGSGMYRLSDAVAMVRPSIAS